MISFNSVAIIKINTLVSKRGFMGFVSINKDGASLFIDGKVATVSRMGKVIWSDAK